MLLCSADPSGSCTRLASHCWSWRWISQLISPSVDLGCFTCKILIKIVIQPKLICWKRIHSIKMCSSQGAIYPIKNWAISSFIHSVFHLFSQLFIHTYGFVVSSVLLFWCVLQKTCERTVRERNHNTALNQIQTANEKNSKHVNLSFLCGRMSATGSRSVISTCGL